MPQNIEAYSNIYLLVYNTEVWQEKRVSFALGPVSFHLQSIYDIAPLFWSSISMSLNSISVPSIFCRAKNNLGSQPPRRAFRSARMLCTCVDIRVGRTGRLVCGLSVAARDGGL
jgi:hypothetical protein